MDEARLQRLTRRAVLGGLLGLPGIVRGAAAADGVPPSRAFLRAPPPVTAAGQVLNVMEFEALAREALPPAHFGYLATGVDDDRTVARNHDAFSHYEIRARRFVDVSHVDTAVELYGARLTSPVYLSAVGGMRAFHAEGELAMARAAASRATQVMLSTASSTAVEPVSAARGAPLWQQLYATDDWAVTEALVRRAERAGCTAIVFTVDNIPGRNNETLARAARVDSRNCTACHVGNTHDMWRKAPMFAGLDVSRVTGHTPASLTPAYLDRLRALVTTKLIVKGIVTGEDAVVAIEHGADGVVVSNHGGRDEESLRATIDCLPEVAAAVAGRVPVLFDGGIRRGTDVFKALALGATAVGIGRPQIWGLAAFGQSGVEAVIDILDRELRAIMRQAGTPALARITPGHVLNSAWR
ncbi:MAG TPA: alpha-hydroxy acid oxidase [Steroidobacteraceae bacterium]|nr:alpha-hydroxy acid oxidase [Steroidobacteraceae bacterium]